MNGWTSLCISVGLIALMATAAAGVYAVARRDDTIVKLRNELVLVQLDAWRQRDKDCRP